MFNWLKSLFAEPPLQKRIAQLLRNGATEVRVVYRHVNGTRYYTGSGNRVGSGFGKRTRYDIQVGYYQLLPGYRYEYCGPILMSMNGNEQDRILDDLQNVMAIKPIDTTEPSTESVVKYLTNIVARLKPGQGYKAGYEYITHDFIQPQGYLFHHIHGTSTLVPLDRMAIDPITEIFKIDKFSPDHVFVADETKIKRQHRKLTDLKRWYVCTQAPSVMDPWVIKFTSNQTGGAPVFYYTLKIDIDNKSMAGYPFYVDAILKSALEELKNKHSDCKVVTNNKNIQVEWNGGTSYLYDYIQYMDQRPAMSDTHPILITAPTDNVMDRVMGRNK